MRELILPHSLRIASDRSSSVRLAFVHLAENALSSHVQLYTEAEVNINVELVVILLVLAADESKEVESEAVRALTGALSHWEMPPSDHALPHLGEDIEDGEVELKNHRLRPGPPPSADISTSQLKLYLRQYLFEITKAFIVGISGWTTGSQVLYLGGLSRLCSEVAGDMRAVLGQLLLPLGSCLLEDDVSVRASAESVCQTLGQHLLCATTEAMVLPYISGSPAGHDNPRSRATGVRLVHHMLVGHLKNPKVESQLQQLRSLLLKLGHQLIAFDLHEYRDTFLREAILLVVRVMIDVLSRELPALEDSSKSELEFTTTTCLVLLMGRVQGDPGGPLVQVNQLTVPHMSSNCTVCPTDGHRRFEPAFEDKGPDILCCLIAKAL